jgi:hypothetical protein
MSNKENSIGDIFNDFINKSEFIELENYYHQSNLFKIIGKHRSETAHSAFWAWLLNPEGSHDLGLEPLEKFIKASIPNFSEDHNLSDITVVTESSIKGGRFDIFIDSNKTNNGKLFSIIIENKIDANENEGQTKKYYDWSVKKNKKKDNYFVYMKPYSRDINEIVLSAEKYNINDFHKISYQVLYDNVLYPLQIKENGSSKNYITEYIHSLSITGRDYGHLIITNDESKYYTVIINKYSQELETAIESYGNDKAVESNLKLNLFFNLLNFIRYNNFEHFSKRTDLINEILDGTRDFTRFDVKDLSGKLLTDKPMPKNQTFNYVLKHIQFENLKIESFKEILPPDLNIGENAINAYLIYDSKEKALEDNPFQSKKRKNPFYDYDNVISLLDKVIVPKKAWNATRHEELNNKSTMEVLIDFVNSNKEVFNIIIVPVS